MSGHVWGKRTGEVVWFKGTQHYVEFMFREVQYTLTGRYGRYKGIIVAEAKGPNDEITWSDEDGNFWIIK